MSRPIALVVAPFRSRTEGEAERTDRAIEELLGAGFVPVFLPYALDRFLDDDDEAGRAVALEASEAFVRRIASSPRGVALFVLRGRRSEGMRRDEQAWCDERSARGYAGYVFALPESGSPELSELGALELERVLGLVSG